MDDPEALPVLTPEIVEDDQALAEQVDEIARRDAEARRWQLEAMIYEDALKAILDADTWKIFLRLD
ncbi:MAG TPA: hypothetical protein VF316_06760, partial [Polyangiaceae bacterium]